MSKEEKKTEEPSTHGFLHKDFDASDWIIFK